MTRRQPDVLLLNGGSSSGKTTLARSLQQVLDGYWLRLGVDTLLDAAPPRLLEAGGLHVSADGTVEVGDAFVEVERQWMAGVAAMATAGARLLLEDNFVSGSAGQQRWRAALRGVEVGWVGVRCAPEVAAAREARRGDRVSGMAARQAEAVHRGIAYDLEVDAGGDDHRELARQIRSHFFGAA